MDSGGVDIMRGLTLALLVVILLLSGACGASLVPVPPPNLDGVEEALGYSLAPTHLPEGFEFSGYDIPLPSTMLPGGQVVMPFGGPGQPYASILYKRFKDYAYHNVLIDYPWSFSPLVGYDFLFERLGLDWQRPEDAVTEVEVNGKTSYLVRGNWSYETLEQLAHPDPEVLAEYVPEWDYEMQLNLYFNFYLSQDEVVEVRILALTLSQPVDWITEKELVKIAESLQRVD